MRRLASAGRGRPRLDASARIADLEAGLWSVDGSEMIQGHSEFYVPEVARLLWAAIGTGGECRRRLMALWPTSGLASELFPFPWRHHLWLRKFSRYRPYEPAGASRHYQVSAAAEVTRLSRLALYNQRSKPTFSVGEYDWGKHGEQRIQALVNARKVAGVHAGSALHVQQNAKENSVYAAMIEGRHGDLYVRIGGSDEQWQPAHSNYSDYREYAWGDGWKVWVRLPANLDVQQAPLKAALPVQDYKKPEQIDVPDAWLELDP